MKTSTWFDEGTSVWKFPLTMCSYQDLELPKGAQILCVQAQYDSLVLWAICDVHGEAKETRHFRVSGTGHRLAFGEDAKKYTSRKYIGTVQFDQGDTILHVFELFND